MIINLIRANAAIIAKIVILTLIFSGLGIGVLSYINERLLSASEFRVQILFEFTALLILFFGASIYANVALTSFGHKLVYEIRKRLIKQILDTHSAQIDILGKARLIVSLNTDIRTISFAFMSAPGLIQGSVFIVAAGVYLCYVSPKLFAFVAVWIGATTIISVFLMKRIRYYFKLSRKNDDELQRAYNDVVEGHRELSLNRSRALACFDELDIVALQKRENMVKADIFHSVSDNFTNIMLLGAVGACVFFCAALGWASLQTAITASLTILFLRGSFIAMISAVPATLSAKVSLDKILKLNLAGFESEFTQPKPKNWRKIEFKSVNFSYPNEQFSLRDLNFTINRGETIFLIGKNGSGKSTFCNVLCGLSRPSSGEILLDGEVVTSANLMDFQANISAIFSDFYLFAQTLGADGKIATDSEIFILLKLLELENKTSVKNGKLVCTALSQGQRKRLALLIALLEGRSLLVLDEWAADQDPIFKRVFYREILPLLKSRGITILAISHDDKYFGVADRLILAKDWRIRELFGTEREIAAKDAVEKIDE